MAEDTKNTAPAPVLITAAPGSRRFDKIQESLDRGLGAPSKISGYKIEANIDGQTYSEEIGNYPKEKFPDSKQGTKPHYDKHLGRFVIKHPDGTEWTAKELNDFVQKHPQYHSKLWFGMPNPRAGERITEANVYDADDPYLNAKIWDTILTEGETELQPNSPVDKFRIATIAGNRTFAQETADNILSGEVEYVIRQPEVAATREEQFREQKEEAIELYQAMKGNSRRMIAILRLFQQDYDESVDPKILRNALWKIVDENGRTPDGKSAQEVFIRRAMLTEDELYLRETVSLASMRKLIFERAGIYEFKGTALGMSYDDVLTKLRSPEGETILESIRMSLNWKK